ncbi:hypothetical protein; putative exported protein [Xenorhabdus nematophila ATCC 19061]|uniref:Uncharacterized protein n=1 Tax=Xenorhabdus nematophila (strain ATCC 19061 / DSM 3370 / CCUG 14189 / LMG 1036 / NCIMB 9965 / AN6) TaxID=406817 RepID=D3VKP9_XENNA|nr:hypothetical protein; putative exported protein [Xenorhabdus nematophila ATCC 19061]
MKSFVFGFQSWVLVLARIFRSNATASAFLLNIRWTRFPDVPRGLISTL